MNKNSAIYTFIFIMLICIVFGVGVSLVHYATLDTMKRNEKLNLNRVICRAFLLDVEGDSPGAYQQAINKNIKADTLAYEGQRFQVYFRKDNHSMDVGFVFSGMGFWDRITGIIVLTADLGKVINIQFLDQKETPGLGARIEEKWFTSQFKDLQIDWGASSGQHLIIGSSITPGVQNRVDAITGATQTSIALENILNDELARFRKVYRHYQREKE